MRGVARPGDAGLAVAAVQARVPGVVLMDADPAGDDAALERLAVWALRRYAPAVAADPPDGLVLDVTGADHLHGGERAMLDGMVERLQASGLAATAAVAGSWGAAHALARHRADPVFVHPPDAGAEVLHDLSIAALRLASGTVDALRLLGLERVGDLVAQPRAPLALRFGPEPGRRLDHLLGLLAEPVDPVRPPDLVEVRRVFGEPIGAPETVARYVGKLVVALCEALEVRGLGARSLDLRVGRVDGHRQAIRIGTALPLRDVKRLNRLLGDRLERVDPGPGIEVLSLAAVHAEPLEPRQTVSDLAGEPEVDVAGLVDLLANRIGERRLYRYAPIASDVPERSVARVAPLAPDDGAGWPAGWPRPARLLSPPEPVDTVALLPDHPPASFTWRGVRRRVRRGDGPERVFGEWWKADTELAAVRDYYRVEDDAGERYWLFRAGDGEDPATGSGRWFIHGVFG